MFDVIDIARGSNEEGMGGPSMWACANVYHIQNSVQVLPPYCHP